jgi:5-methylcytosine-specific restriction endonuclease McrA
LKAARPCLKCGVATRRGSYCPTCYRDRYRPYNDAGYRKARLQAQHGLLGACVTCGTWDRLTIDHVVPLAKGGTNDPANLRVLCLSCNSRRGSS